MAEQSYFAISALGSVNVGFEAAATRSRLSAAKQATIAKLVAAGTEGVTAEQFGTPSRSTAPKNNAAVRMAIARVRDHLPEGALPPAVDGSYRLKLSASDVDVWRLLELAGSTAKLEVNPIELPHLLRPSVPYLGVPDSPLVERSVRTIRSCQRDLFERLSREQPSSLKGEILDHLVEHYREDSFNESLLMLVVVSQARAGHRRLGLETLRAARVSFSDVGLDLSKRLDDIEILLLNGELGEESASIIDEALALPTAVTTQLRRTYDAEPIQLDQLKTMARELRGGTTCVVVSGESGAGKSRLCAELASVAHQDGMRVVYVTPSAQSGDGIFGGLMASLPALRRLTSEVLGRRLDPESTRSLLWAGASDALSTVAHGHPLLLVVDDFQWLDSQSQAYFRHLITGSFESPVLVVLVGRDDRDEERTWAQTKLDALARGAIEIEVVPFSVTSIERLVRAVHPHLHSRMTLTVAVEVHLASRGLPGIAMLLIDDLDDELLMVPSLRRLAKDRPLDALVSSLGPEARTVGSAASVIGLDFELEPLTTILGVDEESVLAAVEVLVGRDLLVEQSNSRFSFAHILVQAAFARSVIGAQMSKWHQSAAEYFTADLHRRAHHEAAALPRTSLSLAVDSLVESARLYLEQGLFRESVRRFRRAEILGHGLTTLADERDFARALDLAGSAESARRVRNLSLDRALGLGHAELALSIATSGLPETEPIDGDSVVVANLERIDQSSLGESGAWVYASHMARQLALLGRVGEASAQASRAVSLARSPYQVVCSAISNRLALSASISTRERLDLLLAVAEPAKLIDSEKRAEYLFLLAIDHYEIGDRSACDAVLDEVGRLERILPPVRRWHWLLFKAMVGAETETNDGGLADSMRLAAHRFGTRSGISEADNGLLTSLCVDKLADARLSELLGIVESGSLDVEGPIVARAGAALILREAGRSEEATVRAEDVVRHVLQRPLSQGTAALALVSLPLSDSVDEGLIEGARQQLSRRGESMIVIGAGVACLGPTSIYQSHLARNRSEARSHMQDAVDFAARVGLGRWESAARRSLSMLDSGT